MRGNEWCISSKNVWGIPMPIFRYKNNPENLLIDKDIIIHIMKLIH